MIRFRLPLWEQNLNSWMDVICQMEENRTAHEVIRDMFKEHTRGPERNLLEPREIRRSCIRHSEDSAPEEPLYPEEE